MRPVRSAISILRSNSFIRHNIIFFAGSMAVAFINYLYYPVMGRLMSNAGFGELQVMVSAFMQGSTILNVLSLVAVGILVNQPDKKIAHATVSQFEKLAIVAGIVAFGVVLLIAEPLRHALKFSTVYPFIVLTAVIIVSIPVSFKNAYLKANKDFVASSIGGAISSSTRLLASAVFVMLSLYTFGAVLGLLVAQVASLFYLYTRYKKLGYQKVPGKRIDLSLIKPQLPYAGFVLVVSLLTTLQISFDVTVAKYYFSSVEAGNYAAVATVARIIFFLTGSVVAVMMSSISTINLMSENRRMLLRSLLLVGGLGGAATIFFCLFPTFVMHVLLGARYDTYAHLLPMLSLTILTGSIVTLFTTYNIAMRHFVIMVPVIAGSLISLVLILLNHGALDAIILDFLVGSLVMLVGLVGYTFTKH